MKIGLIRMRYTPYGGAETFLSRLIEGLLRRGHECHLLANRWDERVVGLEVHRVRAVRWPPFLKVLTFAVNTSRLLEGISLDVILGLERTLTQDIYRAGDGCHREWLQQRRRTLSPLRYATLWVNPLHLTLLHIEKRLFQSGCLKAVIANSEGVKRDIVRHYGLPAEKIHVIYNGIDLNLFDPTEREEYRKGFRRRLGLDSDDTLLLFVGSGFERKGLKPLIEALSILRKKGKKVKLLVVGKGRYRPYREMIRRFGLDGDVILAGPLREIRECYYGSDVFVLPSLYEPFSNACLEAMAAGLPVVTSRANGVSEIMEEGREGTIIEDPLNSQEIAEKILPLLDEDRRLGMGRYAREKAERYPIEESVGQMLKVIEMVKEE